MKNVLNAKLDLSLAVFLCAITLPFLLVWVGFGFAVATGMFMAITLGVMVINVLSMRTLSIHLG